MEPQSKKNQIKHGKYGSIMASHIFSCHQGMPCPLVTRGLPPHVLNFMKSIHKVCLHSTWLYGVLKYSERGSGIFHILQKEELSLLSAIWGNLILHHPCLPIPKKPLSFSFAKQIIYMGTYLKKSFCFFLVPNSHRQSRKRMMNTLLIISRYM